MTHSPATVANYFLTKASQEGRALTPMQLLKLVYIAHGWHLAYYGAPLINEPVQAWRYGPVIKSLYGQVRKYGGSAVVDLIPTGPFAWQRDTAIQGASSALVDAVWKNYSSFSGFQLSQMTHMPDTPWYQVWHREGGSGRQSATISDQMIRDHYLSKLATQQESAQAQDQAVAAW